jgi:hypothetical protein
MVVLQDCGHIFRKAFISSSTESGKQYAIVFKVSAKQNRHAEHILPMRYGECYRVRDKTDFLGLLIQILHFELRIFPGTAGIAKLELFEITVTALFPCFPL